MTDLATGLYAHGAILAALLQRQKTGKGVHIDCNLLSSQVRYIGILQHGVRDVRTQNVLYVNRFYWYEQPGKGKTGKQTGQHKRKQGERSEDYELTEKAKTPEICT